MLQSCSFELFWAYLVGTCCVLHSFFFREKNVTMTKDEEIKRLKGGEINVKKRQRNIMLIIKLQAWVLPGTYSSSLIIHFFLQ